MEISAQCDLFKQAIQLQQAILNLPNNIQTLGACYYDENLQDYWWDELEDYDDKSDEEKYKFIFENLKLYRDYENDAISDKSAFINCLALASLIKELDIDDNPVFKFKIDSTLEILVNISDQEFLCNSKFSQEDLRKLYDYAETATFGNVNTQTTDIDEKIRKGKHISNEHFKISEFYLDKLKDAWNESCDLCKCDYVVPHKINLYQNGDHFEWHKDTPDKNLIGTIVMSISDPLKCNGGKLKFGNGTEWNSEGCVGFYTDIPHCVTKVNGDLIRATMSFKVYASGNPNFENLKNNELLSAFSHLPRPFGFILNHKYSLNSTALKGTDSKLLSILKCCGFECYQFPVCVTYNKEHMNTEHYCDDDALADVGVYPLTDTILSHLLNKDFSKSTIPNVYECLGISPDHIEILKNKEIMFTMLKPGYALKDNRDEGAEYCGNESRPESVDSVYLNHCLIVF